jgi:hypothetical protein
MENRLDRILLGVSLLIEIEQLHDIGGIYPSNRTGAIGRRDNLAVCSDDEFGGLDAAAPIVAPPGSGGFTLFAGGAEGDREVEIARDCCGIFCVIDTDAENGCVQGIEPRFFTGEAG